FPVTGRAGSDGLHLSQEGIADPAYLAAAAAGGAGLYASFILGAAAAAGIAGDIFFYLDILGNSFGYFFIIELDLDAEITAPDAPGTGSTAASPVASEEAAENIVPEDIPEL